MPTRRMDCRSWFSFSSTISFRRTKKQIMGGR